MKKITFTEFKKKYFKSCKEYTFAAYDSQEKHMLKVLVVSNKTTEITAVHAQGGKKPICIMVPSLSLSHQDERELINQSGALAYVTIRDLKTNEKIKTIEYKEDRISSYEEVSEFERITDLLNQSKRLQVLTNERAKEMLDDYTMDQIKSIAKQWKEFKEAKSLYAQHRKEFEGFIKTFGYNPYNYHLVLDKVPAEAI